jgi:hypothetical protein
MRETSKSCRGDSGEGRSQPLNLSLEGTAVELDSGGDLP